MERDSRADNPYNACIENRQLLYSPTMTNEPAAEVELHRIFRDNVRARRTELGLTQKQAADKMGVTQPAWAQIEGRRGPPGLGIVERVAEVLRTTPSQLLMRNAFVGTTE